MSSTTTTPTMPASLQRLFSSAPGPCVSSTPVVVSSLPETPKSSKTRTKKFSRRERAEKPNSPSHKSCFASGSFTDSPSARVVPPPPMKWLIEDMSMDTASDTSGTDSDSNYSSADSLMRDDLMKTPVDFCKDATPASPGIRVTPLQLIAAVASA